MAAPAAQWQMIARRETMRYSGQNNHVGTMMKKTLAAFAMMAAISACTDPTKDLELPAEPLGNFQLGHSEVVAPNIKQLLVSREATGEEWIAAVDKALERRFGRFEGDNFYHLGVSVEGYSLPPALVPGKSALAVHVTVWDDSTQQKLNDEPELFQVIQVFESRLGMTKIEQMDRLSNTVARDVENWLRRMQAEEGWFGGVEDPVTLDAPAETDETSEAASDEEASSEG